MGLSEVRKKLRSRAPIILIEAPAGFGKTYESVAAARDLSGSLEDGQKILLLAHTNTAIRTFRTRLTDLGTKCEAMTLDSFALGNVAPYAKELGLPSPLRVGGDAIPFPVLAEKLNELYGRSETIVRATASRYPIIILDEHQDAREAQHSFVMTLARVGGSRLLIFGDPMQAIFSFNPEDNLVNWPDLMLEANVSDELTDPQRWHSEPVLGNWIKDARTTLKAGGNPAWSTAPEAVSIFRLSELDNIRQFSTAPLYMVSEMLQSLLNSCQGSVALLTKWNANVTGLQRAITRRLRLNEGSDFKPAYDILPNVIDAVGNPIALCEQILKLLKETSTGCNKNFTTRVTNRLRPEGVNLRGSGKMQSFLELLQPLYNEPSLETWCGVVEQIRRKPPDSIGIEQPDCFHVLGAMRVNEGDPLIALDNAGRERRSWTPQHERTVSSIHKVKGQEYDNIILCHCSAEQFPDNMDARKLLYVAMSRAKRRIVILTSKESPSPLLT